MSYQAASQLFCSWGMASAGSFYIHLCPSGEISRPEVITNKWYYNSSKISQCHMGKRIIVYRLHTNSTLICFFKVWAPCYEIEINIPIILIDLERFITLKQPITSAQCEGWPHLFSRGKVLMAQRTVVCHIFWFGSWNCLKNNVRIAKRG